MFSIAYLWHILELGNCLGIRDEGKSSAAFDNAANVRDACLLGQIAQDEQESMVVMTTMSLRGERDRRIAARLSIPYSLVNIPIEIVVRGVGDQRAKANGQGEEDLSDSCIPHERIQ